MSRIYFMSAVQHRSDSSKYTADAIIEDSPPYINVHDVFESLKVDLEDYFRKNHPIPKGTNVQFQTIAFNRV